MSEEDSVTRETARSPALTEIDKLSTVVHAEVRTPWLMLAILAFIVVGFSLLVFLYFEGAEEAVKQRDRIEALQSAILAQESRDAMGDMQRDAKLLAAVESIVIAERTVTQRIIRTEVRAAPTRTVYATVTETVKAKPSKPPKTPGGQFLSSGCVTWFGVDVCRGEAAMGGLLLGLSGLGFVAMRRTTP